MARLLDNFQVPNRRAEVGAVERRLAGGDLAVHFGNDPTYGCFVELWGIEPQTLSMPWRCSTN